MNKDMVFTLIAAMFYLAILYTLVKPSSKGPTIINSIFSAFSDLVRGTVGYTYDTGTGKWSAP
jgi:hypothetical protein